MPLASRRPQFLILLAGCCALLAACGNGTAPQVADTSAPAAGSQVNSPPQIAGAPVTTVTEGSPYSFRPTASDANNDPLTFGIDNRPPWATFNTITGELTGTPTAGTFNNIVVGVSDGQLSAQLPAFSIAVAAASPINAAPTIGGTPSFTATQGTPYVFQPAAEDVDGDPLNFAIANRPTWATFDIATGRLEGTPGAAHIGTYDNIAINVSDGTASTALPAFSIAVAAANIPPTIAGAPPTSAPNNSPTISGTPAASVLQGTQYSFTPGAHDADGDVLTFSIANKPSWASFTTSTGRLQGTPGPEHVGTTDGIVIAVTDGVASAVLAIFSVTVQAAATGSATLTWTPPTTNSDSSTLTNLAGYKVYWGTSQGNYPNSVTLNNAGLASYVVENLVPGTYFFVMTALNGSGAESPHSNEASKTIP